MKKRQTSSWQHRSPEINPLTALVHAQTFDYQRYDDLRTVFAPSALLRFWTQLESTSPHNKKHGSPAAIPREQAAYNSVELLRQLILDGGLDDGTDGFLAEDGGVSVEGIRDALIDVGQRPLLDAPGFRRIVLECCRRIVQTSDVAKDAFCVPSVHNLVVSSLSAESREVWMESCNAIAALARNHSQSQMLLGGDEVQHALLRLATLCDCKEEAVAVARAFGALCHKHPPNKISFGNERVRDALLGLVSRHNARNLVSVFACAISSLCFDSPENKLLFGTQPVLDAIADLCQYDELDEDEQCEIVDSIGIIVSHQPQNQSLYGQSPRIYDALVRYGQCCRTNDLRMAVLDTITDLCEGSSEIQRRYATAAVRDMLLTFLDRCDDRQQADGVFHLIFLLTSSGDSTVQNTFGTREVRNSLFVFVREERLSSSALSLNGRLLLVKTIRQLCSGNQRNKKLFSTYPTRQLVFDVVNTVLLKKNEPEEKDAGNEEGRRRAAQMESFGFDCIREALVLIGVLAWNCSQAQTLWGCPKTGDIVCDVLTQSIDQVAIVCCALVVISNLCRDCPRNRSVFGTAELQRCATRAAARWMSLSSDVASEFAVFVGILVYEAPANQLLYGNAEVKSLLLSLQLEAASILDAMDADADFELRQVGRYAIGAIANLCADCAANRVLFGEERTKELILGNLLHCPLESLCALAVLAKDSPPNQKLFGTSETKELLHTVLLSCKEGVEDAERRSVTAALDTAVKNLCEGEPFNRQLFSELCEDSADEDDGSNAATTAAQ